MADVTPPIRILPMSRNEFKENGKVPTAYEVQTDYFLNKLPSKGGRYEYRKAVLKAKADTIVLFQYDNKIIASAVLTGHEPFKLPQGDYHGTLNFNIDSIQVFKPVVPALLRKVWPKFVRFSHAKLKLDAEAYPDFLRLLTDIKAPVRQIHDLEAPPAARVETTVFRIERDTKLSLLVKSLHKYKCQILTCEYIIVLANGLHYAEGHHVKPLGKPHSGPDILENIVCLCPNHHAACDLGAIRLVATNLRQVTGHVIGQEFLDYHNQTIYPIGRV